MQHLIAFMQRFDSKLVRLKAPIQKQHVGPNECFDSKLVRLKGFMKTAIILYATLMVSVNSIFKIAFFRIRCRRPPVAQILWGVDCITQHVDSGTQLHEFCVFSTREKLSIRWGRRQTLKSEYPRVSSLIGVVRIPQQRERIPKVLEYDTLVMLRQKAFKCLL